MMKENHSASSNQPPPMHHPLWDRKELVTSHPLCTTYWGQVPLPSRGDRV